MVPPTQTGKNVIDFAHEYIHRGQSFHADFVTGSLPANTTVYCYFTPQVGTNKQIHAVISYSVNDSSWVRLYEGNTISGSGSSVPVYNRKRDSANTGSLLCYAWAGTGSSGTGSQIDASFANASGGKNALGGITRSESEWILATGSNYLLGVSGSSANFQFSASLDWYEI